MEKGDQYVLDGDPTEGAMMVAALKAGLTKGRLHENFTIVKEFPFDSNRKMMSVIIKDKAGKHFVVTKGAPDVLFSRCDSILWEG